MKHEDVKVYLRKAMCYVTACQKDDSRSKVLGTEEELVLEQSVRQTFKTALKPVKSANDCGIQ
jgi:hypothetical protein